MSERAPGMTSRQNASSDSPVDRRFGRWMALIVSTFVALGVVYALSTPPLEASDEYKHYPYVQYVQHHWSLPVLQPDVCLTAPETCPWLQDGGQPPFYYVLMAALSSGIDTSDLAEVRRVNEHAFVGHAAQVGNKNLIIHQPELEAFPWQGTVLAVYVIRLASIALGIGTILLTARLGCELFNPTIGLLAAALTAFNPMFLFVSAAVNNDSLTILVAHLGLVMLLLLWRQAPDPRRSWWRYVGLGLVLGLGALTKLSLLGLVGLTGLALAHLAWSRSDRRFFFIGGVLVITVVLAISGWWFYRNLRLYGDPLGMEAFVAVQGVREAPLTWQGWMEEFGTLYRSYWGLFGGVNVAAPQAFYIVCNTLMVIGMAGLVARFWRSQASTGRGTWLLIGWAAILGALLIRWTVIYPSFQGRLLFPALGAMSVLASAGLLHCVPDRWRTYVTGALALTMAATAAALPWLVIRPAYAYPEPLDSVPTADRFGPITYRANSDQIQLIGAHVPSDQTVFPGQGFVEVVLYWRAAGSVERDYVSSVHLLGRDHQSVGRVNRHPANGMIPTGRWEPGEIWRDVYHVYVDPGMVAPTRLRVSVGLYDTQAGRTLDAYAPDGSLMELVVVGEARLSDEPDVRPEMPARLDVALADGIELGGYALEPQAGTPGEPLRLTLYWHATGEPSQDYTVFVHLLDPAGGQITTADGPPVGGDYPTSMWQPDDWVDDTHVVSLPLDLVSGKYRIAVGLYDPASGARLSRLDGAGDAIIFPVTIEAER